MARQSYDDVVVGSGVGGLFTAALLAASGRRVLVLERHYATGGYGHSFRRRGYVFCAELHYIFNCLAGQDGERFFRRLGLSEEVRFVRLDPDGFDRVHFPGVSYAIPVGCDRNIELLGARFPMHRTGLVQYFRLLNALCDELYAVPLGFSLSDALRHPLRYRHVVAYRRWTLQDLFDRLEFPLELQAILASQSLDIAVPPAAASLLIHAGNAMSYDRGACVPVRGYRHLFDTVSDFIRQCPGSDVETCSEVVRLHVEGSRVVAAELKNGQRIAGSRFLYNGDPQLLIRLVDRARLPASFLRKLRYTYSASALTLHIGLKDIDLRDYGFGNWNMWYYPDLDINGCYRRQLVEHQWDEPMLFISTPTLHRAEPPECPPGHDQMVVVTLCDYATMRRIKGESRDAYCAEKARLAEAVLRTIERHFCPPLRAHVDCLAVGTPTTNEHYCLAPQGNCYGQALTPENIRFGRIDYRTPFGNLFLCGATAGIPSFGGGLHCAMQLAEKLGCSLTASPATSEPLFHEARQLA